jgi:hypothetical protein
MQNSRVLSHRHSLFVDVDSRLFLRVLTSSEMTTAMRRLRPAFVCVNISFLQYT